MNTMWIRIRRGVGDIWILAKFTAPALLFLLGVMLLLGVIFGVFNEGVTE